MFTQNCRGKLSGGKLVMLADEGEPQPPQGVLCSAQFSSGDADDRSSPVTLLWPRLNSSLL